MPDKVAGTRQSPIARQQSAAPGRLLETEVAPATPDSAQPLLQLATFAGRMRPPEILALQSAVRGPAC